MLAQITQTLRVVGPVEVRAGQGGTLLTGPASLDPPGPSSPVALVGDTLMQADTQALLGGPWETLRASAPALSEDRSVQVVLSGADSLALVSEGEPRTLLTGRGLVRPSVDRHGWVWTASSSLPGDGLRAVDVAGQEVRLSPDWLGGRTVQAVRVAPDGTRVAVVSSGPDGDGVRVDVAGLVRDVEGGPQSLREPVRVGVGLVAADQVVWSDDHTLVLLGRSADAPVLTEVPVTGISQVLSSPADVVTVAANGYGTVMVVTADGSLLTRRGDAWSPVSTQGHQVRDLAYPG
jgi:hypothetical protein